MAALSTIIAGVGLAIGAAGAVTSVAGAQQQAQAAKRAERLRERQMELEAMRQRRAALRAALRARSVGLVNATAQGAGSGSGIQGGYGQIGGDLGNNMVGINQATQIGAGIFEANRQGADGASLAAFGSGLSSLGGSLVSNADTLGRLGTYATTPKTNG